MSFLNCLKYIYIYIYINMFYGNLFNACNSTQLNQLNRCNCDRRHNPFM